MPHRVSLFGCIALLAVFYAFNVTGQHGWADDGALYLRHAQNLLAHRSYSDIRYTATPRAGEIQRAYPPGLPLALAPILYFSGLNFGAFKWEMYAFYLAALALIPAAFRKRLGTGAALAVILLLGLNPKLLVVVDHVNANVLALLLNLLFVIVVERSDPRSVGQGALAGLVATAAFATSSLGAAAVLGLALYTLLRYRRPTRFLAAAILVVAVLMVVLHGYFGVEGNYLKVLWETVNYMTLRRNLIQYPLAVATLFGGGWPAGIVVAPCLLAGCIRALRGGIGIWECIAAFHLAMALVWPFSDPYRFLLAILPLIVCYIVMGFEALATRLPRPARYAIASLLLAAVAVSFARGYFRDYLALRHEGMFTPESRQVWDYVRAHTPAESMIIFRKPRTLALLTGRHAAAYATTIPPGEDWNDLCAVHPDYILTSPAIFAEDREVLDPVVERERGVLDVAFSNAKFELYAVRPGGCSPP